MINIIQWAFRLVARVDRYRDRARRFFYAVMLSEKTCPECSGSLAMAREGRCQCRNCGHAYDPTIQFQPCSKCGGKLKLRVRQYVCRKCNTVQASRFLFDGSAFDAIYFRQKMAESRERKKKQLEQVRKMLAESRSLPVQTSAADLGSVPGLVDALNNLTADAAAWQSWAQSKGFDLKRYQSHIQAHLQPFEITFGEIPPLDKNARLDRVWRFIAIIFMAHNGLLRIWQEGPDIMVMQYETDTEGQGFPGEAEEPDGFEGALGRATAW